MLAKAYRVIDLVRVGAIVVILGGVIVLCAVQIALRYLTSTVLAPFAWGDEIIRLSSVWVVFLAASLGVKESSHLSVEFFVKKMMSGVWSARLKKAATVVVLAVLAAIVYYGVLQAALNVSSMLENLPVSRAWFYAAIPVGCAYIFVDYLLILVYGEHPFSRSALAGAGGVGADDSPNAGGEG